MPPVHSHHGSGGVSDADPISTTRVHRSAQTDTEGSTGHRFQFTNDGHEVSQSVAIIRVSGQEQGTKGASLPEQKAQLVQYSDRNGLAIPVPVEDLADRFSAPAVLYTSIESATEKSTPFRRVWQQALQHARPGVLFLVTRIDRWSRSTLFGLQALRHIQTSGARLVSLAENIDTATPLGKHMFTQFLSWAEMEATVIAERTSGGRRRLRGEGNFTEGPVPLGYRRGRRKKGGAGPLEICKEEATIVVEAFQLCDSGLSTRKIASLFQKKHRGVRKWTNNHVSSILRSRVYIGEIRAQARTGEWIKAHPAIVPDDLFYRVQGKLDAARADKGRPPNPERYDSWFLHGLMNCGLCGASIRSSHYYQSAKSKVRLPRRTTHTGYYVCYRNWYAQNCGQTWPFLKNDDVHERVAAEISDRLDRLHDLWAKAEISVDQRTTPRDFTGERKKLREKLQRIADGYAEGTITKTDARRVKDETEKELAKLDAEERRAKAEREAVDPATIQRSLLKGLPSLRELWAHGTPLEQREVTELLTERIDLFPNGDVTVTYRDMRQVFKKLGFIGGGGFLDETVTSSGASDQV